MRLAVKLCVTAAFLALLALPAAAQGGRGNPGDGKIKPKEGKVKNNDCIFKQVVKGYWCVKEAKLLDKDDINKKKVCASCEEKPVKVTICVKKIYVPDCHPNRSSGKPIT